MVGKMIWLTKECKGLGRVSHHVSNPKTIAYYKELGWTETKTCEGKKR
jgi:hypothetical protein